jgi:hypothetical protein
MLIILPEIVTSEVVIVESVTIVTGQIAHIGDVEFNIG